jgi:hypothetical protein
MGAVGSEDGVPVNEKGVQIVAGPAGRKGKPAGVDIIRTLFKGGDGSAQAPQRSDDAHGKDGFSRPAPKGGDNDARGGPVLRVGWCLFQKRVHGGGKPLGVALRRRQKLVFVLGPGLFAGAGQAVHGGAALKTSIPARFPEPSG